MTLVLASASPRRAELLASLGLEFRVETAPAIDEKRLLADTKGTWSTRLKSLAYSKGISVAKRNPEDTVLSADTEVILDNVAQGKAADTKGAEQMLARLSGRRHTVITAVSVIREADDLRLQTAVRTEVCFERLSPRIVRRYIELVKPFDFAGAYAIQGIGALLVKSIDGDYSNVVGLPLRATARLLSKAGIKLL